MPGDGPVSILKAHNWVLQIISGQFSVVGSMSVTFCGYRLHYIGQLSLAKSADPWWYFREKGNLF